MGKKKVKYPKEFLEHIKSITNKRANIVIDHIMKHGFITTEDLENTYGYNHPPRAARDEGSRDSTCNFYSKIQRRKIYCCLKIWRHAPPFFARGNDALNS